MPARSLLSLSAGRRLLRPVLGPVLGPALVLAGVLLAPGCGPDCQSTCNTLFQESECNLQRPGQSRDDLLRDCNTACDNALDTPGDIRAEYNPNDYQSTDQSVRFENDKEVALWMDCVEATACPLLDDGICSPTSSFNE
jgi:hypothetical protein